MSSRPHRRRVKRQHDSDSDSSVGSSGGVDSEDGTTPRLQPRPGASSHHHQAPNVGYFPHRHFAPHQLPPGSQSQHRDAAGLHVFATADGTEYRPEGNEPVGQGPGGDWACCSPEAGAGLALTGAPGRLSQQETSTAAFQGALQGLGQGGAAGQAGPGSQLEHQAIIRGAFPTHLAFPRHDASLSTGHQPLQHRLAHQPIPPPPPQQVFQQSGTFQLPVEHNHNHHHQYHHHDVLATPPADIVAPPYPPHPPQSQPSLFHHHHHQPQHSSGAVDPPPTDPRPPSAPAPTAAPNHDHDPAGLLCHPYDPRLAHLQPHHTQAQHHPHHHAHHQNIVAHAAGYFPLNAADQQPALPLDDFNTDPPRYFFPTPLDHPDHPQHPPLAPGDALALVPYHDADQINQFYQQLPSNWPLAQGPGGLWSPMMQEMSILNAESYNDGTSSFRPPRSISDLKNTAPTRASLPSRRSKDTLKRTKDETVDQSPKDAEEPPRKRGRGRPKLSNSEESPAERRRVQIRLAQRNYRSRKERNVVILEQKIKDLDRVAADMSQAFTQLHDFALARGMLESDPEFGRRLQATTQTFLTLARKSHEIVTAEIVDVDKQQGASGEQHDANPSKDTPAVSATSPGMSPEKKSGGNNTASAGSSSGDQQVLMAGLIVTHEPVMNYTEAIAPPPPSTAAAHAPPGSWSQNDPSPSASSSHHHPAASAKTYEVVSHPTVHNASFPFGMSLETPETTAMPITTTTTTTSANPHNFPFHVDLDASGFVDPSHTTIPDPYPPSFFSQYSPATGLDPSLPPSSFAYLERTFGRRLQRTALERGLRLLHMPDPPPHFFAAVFGFCLLFESRESIVKRMTDCTSVNEKETLSNWRFPFLQLGGAGTFFPELNEMDDPDMALNLQDAIIGPGNLGFGVSSMASAAAEGDEYQQQQQQQPENTPRIGNRGLLEPHRSKIAPDSMFGQGPWTPEIENTRDLRVDRKLRIVVPGWEGDFYDCDEVEWYLQQRGVVIPPAADFVTAEIDQDDFLGGQKAGPTKAFDATIDNFINDWLMKDFVADGGTGGAVAAQLATPSASADTPIGESELSRAENLLATRDGEPVTDKGKARHKAPAVPQVNTFTGGIPPVATPGKRLVTINVNTLVDELTARSVCLGRTPGIRPKDVDGAFWSSVTLV